MLVLPTVGLCPNPIDGCMPPPPPAATAKYDAVSFGNACSEISARGGLAGSIRAQILNVLQVCLTRGTHCTFLPPAITAARSTDPSCSTSTDGTVRRCQPICHPQAMLKAVSGSLDVEVTEVLSEILYITATSTGIRCARIPWAAHEPPYQSSRHAPHSLKDTPLRGPMLDHQCMGR